MPLYHKLIICSLILGTVTLVTGDVEMKFETNDHPGPYRRYSKELQDLNPERLQGLDEAAFARMTLDDPLLKLAYTKVFTQSLRNIGAKSPEQFLYTEPTEAPALADMRKRGDSAIPLLLKLLEENQETGFETSLLGKIDLIGTISLDPFIEYARNLLRDRTQTMSASAAGSAAVLLSMYGSKEDAELLKRVMAERPYVADSVTRKLDALLRRVNPPPPSPRPELKDRPKMGEESTDIATNEILKTLAPNTATSGSQLSATALILWVFGIIALLLVCVLGLKRPTSK